MAVDYLTSSFSDIINSSASATATQLPNVAPNPSTTGWFDRVNQGLGSALGLYAQYEQVRAFKNANGTGAKEHLETWQSPAAGYSGYYETPADELRQKMGQGLQIGTGTFFVVVGAVALLYFLSNKD